MKRTISLVLLFMQLVLLAACGGTEQPSETTADTVETVETTPVETEEALEAAIQDYGGYTVNIALTGNWEQFDFMAEELTGEAINDARYNANQAVAERYNVTFTVDNQSTKDSGGTGAGYQLVDNMVMAGTNDYEFFTVGCYDVATLAYSGRLLNLNAVPNLDLSKSWWDPKANEHLSIRDMMFFTTGDIVTLDNDCTYCILFNKQVVTDYGLDNPYELVANDQWTYDKMYEMADVVDGDTNGNGQKDLDDSFGFIVWHDSVMGMLHASSGRFASIEGDGTISLSLYNERNIDVLTAWLNVNTSNMVWSLGGTDQEVHNIFINNRALFYTRYLKAVSWFRDMETDFGLLPYPKWDNTQSDYCNSMHTWGSAYVCLPVTAEDPARAGAIMESLAYYGQKYITPAYYETTLKGKYFRDEESAAMLDIIFRSRFFDIGAYYRVGTINQQVVRMMESGSTDFASMYSQYEQSARAQLDEINAAYAAMN